MRRAAVIILAKKKITKALRVAVCARDLHGSEDILDLPDSDKKGLAAARWVGDGHFLKRLCGAASPRE